MEQKLVVTKISTFTSKKTNPPTDYYVIEGVLSQLDQSEKSRGHEHVQIFTTKEKYLPISQKFDGSLKCEIDVVLKYSNGRATFEVA